MNHDDEIRELKIRRREIEIFMFETSSCVEDPDEECIIGWDDETKRLARMANRYLEHVLCKIECRIKKLEIKENGDTLCSNQLHYYSSNNNINDARLG